MNDLPGTVVVPPEGDLLILETETHFTPEQHHMLAEYAANHGKSVLVLPPGVRVSREEQLLRIEEKLDILIAALAEDDPDAPPTHDLEGARIPRPDVVRKPPGGVESL